MAELPDGTLIFDTHRYQGADYVKIEDVMDFFDSVAIDCLKKGGDAGVKAYSAIMVIKAGLTLGVTPR